MSEQNKATSRVAFEVWSSGDLDRLDTFIAPDVVHHDPYDPYGADGLTGMKKLIKKNRNIHPDLQITIEDQIAEGDKVATRWIATMEEAVLADFTRFEGIVEMRLVAMNESSNSRAANSWPRSKSRTRKIKRLEFFTQ